LGHVSLSCQRPLLDSSSMTRTMHSLSPSMSSRKLFDTWKFVRHLEAHGLSRRQSVAIMMTIDTTLRDSVQDLSSSLLSPLDMELAKKAAHSTMTGSNHPRQLLQTLRQTDFISLQSQTELLQREIEKLGQTFSDANSALKSEISMDLNNHKSDMRDISSEIDLRTQQVGHRLVVKISALRTHLERLKVELTRDIICETSLALNFDICICDSAVNSSRSIRV
jgi:hypothetical protein